jgi:glycine oxidase
VNPDVLILGQGLAGTLLAWELERAGIDFAIADAGHDRSATHVAAGLINPITGRRLVKTTGVEALLPVARETYQDFGRAVGVTVWRDLRVHRLLVDERERRVAGDKFARGELAPYVQKVDAAGVWIDRAAQVDLRALITAGRARWQAQGRWRAEEISGDAATRQAGRVIDCRGLPAAREGVLGLPWRWSKGETLEIEVAGLTPDVVLNDGQWVVPMPGDRAWIGATHEPGVLDREPTAEGRAVLEQAAHRLLDRPFTVRSHWAGVRVHLPDKLPVAGVDSANPRRGLINGLGAKGALFAPTLARSWAEHLAHGRPFDPVYAPTRFGAGQARR